MKRRKVIGFVLVFFLLFSCALYAEPISFVGWGNSIEEARANARADLNAFFNGALIESSSSYSMKEESYYDDISYELSITSNTKTRGYLKCVNYIDERNAEGLYSSKAIIEDSTSNMMLFLTELNMLNSSLSQMDTILHRQSKNDRIETLLQMYDLLVEYECYSLILLYMGYGSYIPPLSIDETSRSVYFQYRTLLNDSKNNSLGYDILDTFLLKGKWTGEVTSDQFTDYYTLEFKDDSYVIISVESVANNGTRSFCSGNTKYQYNESNQILTVNIPQMKGSISHLKSINWKTMVVINGGNYSCFSVIIPISSSSSQVYRTTFNRQ